MSPFSTVFVSDDHGLSPFSHLTMNHHPATPGAELLRRRLAVPVARLAPGFGSGGLLPLGQGKMAPGRRALPLLVSSPSSLTPLLRGEGVHSLAQSAPAPEMASVGHAARHAEQNGHDPCA